MIRHLATTLLALLLALPLMAAEQLTSPDGRYVFTFEKTGGQLGYSLSFCGQPLISHGRLGVQVDNHLVEQAMGIPVDTASTWTADMTVTGVERSERDTTWTPVYGELSQVRDHYRQMVIHLFKGQTNEDGKAAYDKRKAYLFDIVVRAYNEGVAWRYHFPEATNGLFMRVTRDLTTYPLPAGTHAWQEHWAQGPFIGSGLTTSEWTDESERPLLLRLPSGLNVALLEANLHDFVRGKFRLLSDNVIGLSLYQDADVITPYDMPWRLVMAGGQPRDLVNNKQVVLNLNEPAKGDFSYCKPGKAFRSGLRRQEILASIHFAKQMNLQYVELDAGWYGPEMLQTSDARAMIPRWGTSLKEICDSAAAEGIGIWLYVNQRALSNQIDSLLPLYARLGVKGLKFGFVQVGNQYWTRWLHNAVEKCARYGLMVDIHDEYRPTGWSRTFPNLMTQEGVGGNEEMPDAHHNLMLPFTRFLSGPADYTPCYFSGRVKNTKAHQLAMPVVYYSPITFLFWYDNPSLYHGERELDFWREMPTTWDDSRCLDGEPGEWIVQARRSGTEWYVGVMNGLTARDVTIDTSAFLQKGRRYRVELYTDDPMLHTRTNVRTEVVTLKAGKPLKVHLLASGGAAMRFVPVP
jgi:alpha-glucosidase